MKAIVLAGGQEFGQCPLSRQLPRALWPLLDRPLVEHIVEAIHGLGISEMAISANGRTHDIAERLGRNPLGDVSIHYSEDTFPRGAAGCIKDCQDWLGGGTFIVAHGASLLIGVDLQHLLAEHRRRGGAITIAADGPADRTAAARPTGLYICEPEILGHIPRRGYHDMKEQLIPRLMEEGLKISAGAIRGRIVPIRHEEGYLNAILELLQDPAGRAPFTRRLTVAGDGDLWIDPTAQVHPRATLVGPVYVGADARIAAGAMLIGPAAVGSGVDVEDDALVHEAILWAGAKVGRGARVEQAVVAAGGCVEAASVARASIVMNGL